MSENPNADGLVTAERFKAVCERARGTFSITETVKGVPTFVRFETEENEDEEDKEEEYTIKMEKQIGAVKNEVRWVLKTDKGGKEPVSFVNAYHSLQAGKPPPTIEMLQRIPMPIFEEVEELTEKKTA